MSSKRKDHGGDIYSGNNKEGLIDLSSNINPEKIPDRVYDNLKNILDLARVYPDIEYRRLRDGIAAYLERQIKKRPVNITEDMIATGNGASDITDRIISLFKRAVIPVPSFTEYEASAERYGVKTVFLPVYDGEITEENINGFRGRDFFRKASYEMREGTLLILTNPNNPDGQVYDRESLIEFLEEGDKKGWFTLIDETFGEFLKEELKVCDLVSEFKNLIIIKAVTKFFGLPGIRMGYAVSLNKEILDKASDLDIPWSVGTFDENIALMMMNDEDYIERSFEHNIENREYLRKKIADTGIFSDVYPSESAFIMARIDEGYGTSEELRTFLRDKGILIRTLHDMRGLSSDNVRIAVKSEEKTDRLIEEIEEYRSLKQGGQEIR